MQYYIFLSDYKIGWYFSRRINSFLSLNESLFGCCSLQELTDLFLHITVFCCVYFVCGFTLMKIFVPHIICLHEAMTHLAKYALHSKYTKISLLDFEWKFKGNGQGSLGSSREMEISIISLWEIMGNESVSPKFP